MHRHLDVHTLTDTALNFHMGAQMGELVKLLKAKGLWDEALPTMDLLFNLCKEAGGRAQRNLPNVGWFASTLCEGRNLWGMQHEMLWLETDENHPDDWIGNYIRDQLMLALRE